MSAKIKVEGVIVPNDYVWWYRWYDEACTCPADIENAIASANGDLLEVEIDSPGGDVAAGSDIYTALRKYGNIKIQIFGQACSAASVIAMAGPNEMSPTALMMVHCVSTYAQGNHNDMEKAAEMLSTADKALCTAYVAKSGMSEEDALQMMESEKWLTAEDAVEYGLVDKVMFSNESVPMVAGLFRLPTQEELDAARKEMEAKAKEAEATQAQNAAMAKFNYLRLKGERQYEF